jgi:hypothetical protein
MAYTTTTNKLSIVDLDFDSIKAALVSYLDGQDTFKDYNFEGSAMSILLDVLAYNTHYNGFYTNMLASEMFMDSATLRSSVVSLAKHLGYIPASRTGATVNVDLSINDSLSNIPANISIPKGTKFVSRGELSNQLYTFLTTESYTAKRDEADELYKVSNVNLKEGVVFTESYTALGSVNESFVIANKDIDISTLVVRKNQEIYQRVSDITEITALSKVYWLQESRQGNYELYFGDSILGESAKTADSIAISYYVSMLGVAGNDFKTFVLGDLVGPTGGALESYIATTTLSSGNIKSKGGSEKETTESIKVNAPLRYSIQDRFVTAGDYRTTLLNTRNDLEAIRVWGGEDNIPPAPGYVFISAKPKNGRFLSMKQKNEITEDINRRNVLTVNPVFVTPEILDIVLTCKVKYDPRESALSSGGLERLIRTGIVDYGLTINKFDEYFRSSVLATKIAELDRSIKNSLIEMSLAKTVDFYKGNSGRKGFVYDNPLFHPHDGHASILSSSRFSFTSVGGKRYDECSFVDDNGKLQIISNDVSLLALATILDDNSLGVGEGVVVNEPPQRAGYGAGGGAGRNRGGRRLTPAQARRKALREEAARQHAERVRRAEVLAGRRDPDPLTAEENPNEQSRAGYGAGGGAGRNRGGGRLTPAQKRRKAEREAELAAEADRVDFSALTFNRFDQLVIKDNVGSIDYGRGQVMLNQNLGGFSTSNYVNEITKIKFNVIPDETDVVSKHSRLIYLDETNTIVTMIDDTDIIESKKYLGY